MSARDDFDGDITVAPDVARSEAESNILLLRVMAKHRSPPHSEAPPRELICDRGPLGITVRTDAGTTLMQIETARDAFEFEAWVNARVHPALMGPMTSC